MREALKPFQNFRFNYIATFDKFGINYVSGKKYQTALLKDLKNSYGDYLCEHIWIRDLKLLKKLNLKQGDKITFSAMVKKYQRGHVENYIGENEDLCDYSLLYLENVKKICR